MARKVYSTEDIIKHLRTVEIEQSKGKPMEGMVGVRAITIAKWQREYGGLHLDKAKLLKEAGIAMPISFFNAFMIHGIYGLKG